MESTKARRLIDSAVLEGVNLVLTYLACLRLFKQPLTEIIIEESRFNDGACDNWFEKVTKFRPAHITPYSKDGKTIPSNGQLAHRGCNASKNAKVADLGCDALLDANVGS
jgi:HNH endonuclease